MASLPTGTVTFLFSDVEGSTELVRTAGGAYAGLLADVRRLLREEIAANGGAEGAKGSERNVYASERFAGKFRRVVALPEDAEPGRVEATYRNGVLKIVVPKRESSKPRQIQVSSAS